MLFRNILRVNVDKITLHFFLNNEKKFLKNCKEEEIKDLFTIKNVISSSFNKVRNDIL